LEGVKDKKKELSWILGGEEDLRQDPEINWRIDRSIGVEMGDSIKMA